MRTGLGSHSGNGRRGVAGLTLAGPLLLVAALLLPGGCGRQKSVPVATGGTGSTMVDPARPQPVSTLPSGLLPPVTARAWRYIVIHHSATDRGGAEAFDAAHRRRGWDELGYHFVVGNGTYTADGQIEVGSRWTKQKHGAHAGVPLYNEQGIGICLVGDFNIRRPTSCQMDSLARLVCFLTKQYGIPYSQVLGHRDIKATECPGRLLDMGQVRQRAAALCR